MSQFGTHQCPFSVGDTVRYTPSRRGLDHEVDAVQEQRLTPDAVYRIERIDQNVYVTVEGYQHPGGGIYWTEFSVVSP